MAVVSSTTMKAPEMLVFGRALLLGALLFEVFCIAWLVGTPFGQWLVVNDGIGVVIVICTLAVFIGGAYARKRGVFDHVKRVYASHRWDLLALAGLGASMVWLLKPQLQTLHAAVSRADKFFAPALLAVLLAMLAAPMWRELLRRKRPDATQMYFLDDAEIDGVEQDLLGVAKRASEFADTVLTSGARSGLVFGIDAPWGVGKTSFLNLAKKRWREVADDEVIVFTFEPLRYASEPDLAERFIKDLCAAIRQKVFAPEFLPAASRYARMLKGKTDLSMLGIKFSFEPSSETIDELLEDIDDLLKQIGRRLIVIVDDLDRLDNKLVNNVLFTVRRTFRLTQASYILCYDTEALVASAAGKDDGARAREFLEKFITAQLSLFVDMKSIRDYLDSEWNTKAASSDTVTATERRNIGAIAQTVRELLASKDAHFYGRLLGDMRKVKRFVNAALLMDLGKVDLEEADFDRNDLVHLMLLHLRYPELFRRIYAEETDGRSGSFGARLGDSSKQSTKYVNGAGLSGIPDDVEVDHPDQFLLRQLFDVEPWVAKALASNDETPWRTRACFNGGHRNLERHLELIVRLKVPVPTDSYRLYKNLLQEVMEGRLKVADVLRRPDFSLALSESPQETFWAQVGNHANSLSRAAADDAINILVEWLPKYSSLHFSAFSMRHRAVDSLLLLLDRAGFGELPGNGRVRNMADLPELAVRLLGSDLTPSFPSLVRQLVAPDRGALGWRDLMLLRLNCWPGRSASASNVWKALARSENAGSQVTDDLRVIPINAMRRLSQKVFEQFRQDYIDRERNFFLEVDRVSDEEILGEGGRSIAGEVDDLEAELQSSRSGLKNFVIYQLAHKNSEERGDGPECGFFDEAGSQDAGGIQRAMTRYLLEFCFDPGRGVAHARAFADFCLRSFRDAPSDFQRVEDPEATQKAVTNLLGREAMAAFWRTSGDRIKQLLNSAKGTVYCYGNFKMTYDEGLPRVFRALDQMVELMPLPGK